MKSIILAAGYATRLYPLTENFPKPLLEVGGKTIIDRLIDDLDTQDDITGHIVISNHRFIDHFRDWEKSKTTLKPITIIDDGSTDNEHRLGAVNDLKMAVETLDLRDDLLVLAGDNVLDFSLDKFIRFAREKGTSAVMCHEENDPQKQRRTAIITIDKDNMITSYQEKPDMPKGNLAVPPFYYYTRYDASRINEAIEDGCGTDAPGSLAAWLSGVTKMHAWLMSGCRYDIGDLESFENAKRIFI